MTSLGMADAVVEESLERNDISALAATSFSTVWYRKSA